MLEFFQTLTRIHCISLGNSINTKIISHKYNTIFHLITFSASFGYNKTEWHKTSKAYQDTQFLLYFIDCKHTKLILRTRYSSNTLGIKGGFKKLWFDLLIYSDQKLRTEWHSLVLLFIFYTDNDGEFENLTMSHSLIHPS